MLREEYLQKAVEELRLLFMSFNYEIPMKVRACIGLPSRGAFSLKKRVIGQCWSPKASSDTYHEIFVSPTLSDTTQVIGTLVHELVHATVGLEHKHKKPFISCARAVGLVGKPTSTEVGPELNQWIENFAQREGRYPVGHLTNYEEKKPQKTYLLKVSCPSCGYTARVTKKWIDEKGAPLCPEHSQMEVQE